MGVLKLGTVALDGTKIHANASRHSAVSYEHVGRIEAQLRAEVADLMTRAEAADQADVVPPPPPPHPTAPTTVEAMAYRMKTAEGKSPYRLRKHTPEPVFGIIKSSSGSDNFCSAESTVPAANGAS